MNPVDAKPKLDVLLGIAEIELTLFGMSDENQVGRMGRTRMHKDQLLC